MRVLFGAFALLASWSCWTQRPQVTLDIASFQPLYCKVTEENINNRLFSKIFSSHNRIDAIVYNSKLIWKASNKSEECFYAKMYSNTLDSVLIVNYGSLPGGSSGSTEGHNTIAYYIKGPTSWNPVPYSAFYTELLKMGWNPNGLVNVSLDVSQISNYTFTVFHNDLDSVSSCIFIGTDNSRITKVVDYCSDILAFDKEEIFTDAVLFFDKDAPSLLSVSYISVDRACRKNVYYKLIDLGWRIINKDLFYSEIIRLRARGLWTEEKTKDSMIPPMLFPALIAMLSLLVYG